MRYRRVVEVPDVIDGKLPVAINDPLLDTGGADELAAGRELVDADSPDLAKVLIEFGRFAERNRKAQGRGKRPSPSLDSRTSAEPTSGGANLSHPPHTIRGRLRDMLQQVKETIRRTMRRPIAEQGLI